MPNDLIPRCLEEFGETNNSGLFKIELLKVKLRKVQIPKPHAESNLQLGRGVLLEPELKEELEMEIKSLGLFNLS